MSSSSVQLSPTIITPTSSIQDFSSFSGFPSVSSASPSPTFASETSTLTSDNNDNNGMPEISRSSSLLFGFLITFLALFIGFMACGYSSRRASQLRGERGMQYAAQLRDLRFKYPQWNKPPHLWDAWVDDGLGKSRWEDMMPLSASIVSEEKRPSSSPHDVSNEIPPSPSRLPNPPAEDYSPAFVFASRAFSRMGLSIPPPPPRTPRRTSPRPSRQTSIASFVLPTSTFMLPSSSPSSSRPQQQQTPNSSSSSSSRNPNANPNLDEIPEGDQNGGGNASDQQHRRQREHQSKATSVHAQISVIIAMPNPSTSTSISPSSPPNRRLSELSSGNSHKNTTPIRSDNDDNPGVGAAGGIGIGIGIGINEGVFGGDYQIGVTNVPIFGFTSQDQNDLQFPPTSTERQAQ